jgi:hypothetical protein
LDKKDPEIIRQVILWVKDINNVSPNGFTWFHNIESGKKLRDKFDRLYGEMQTEKTRPPGKAARLDFTPSSEQTEKLLDEQKRYRNEVMKYDLSDKIKKMRNMLIPFANQFHRVDECGKLEPIGEAGESQGLSGEEKE